MAFVDDLASGKLGLVVVPPDRLAATAQTDMSATFRDPNSVGWRFYFFPDIHLDLEAEHMSLLRRDIHRHTRLLFDIMFMPGASGMKLPSESRPRTDDPSWTPVVEIERVEVTGGVALTVLHRMHYQPTKESVMGHTLVPVEGGLFEARWLSMTQTTGLRESVLMLKTSDNKEARFQPQSVYDDPAHDADFPQHPLSLARTAKHWHSNGTLKLTSSPPRRPSGDITLDPIGCAIAAPPRFIPQGLTTDHKETSCVLARVSFSGVDGIDRLIVTRTRERIRGIAVGRRLAKVARDRAMDLHQQLANVTCSVTPLEVERPTVVVVTEGDPGQIGCGRARTVERWFIDDTGHVWWIAIATTVAVPIDELSKDVADIATSWRRL